MRLNRLTGFGQFFRTRTISRDLTFGLVGTVVIVILGVAISFGWHTQREQAKALAIQATETSSRLTEMLTPQLWNINHEQIQQIGRVFAELPSVVYLEIVDDEGTVRFMYQAGESPSLHYKRTMQYNGLSIGRYSIGFTDTQSRASTRQMIRVIALLLVLISIAVSLVILLLLERYYKQPLLSVTQGLESIALGDFNYRLPDQHQADMQEIADAINALAESVQHRDQRLQQAKAQLELRVNERTTALMETNEQLRQEVTIRRLTEEQLRDAKDAAESGLRARSQFLAMMSHEIRTPMNGVIGMTTLLQQTPLNSEQSDYVKTIQQSGDSLLTILNDILDFSKIEAGRIDLEAHPTSVRMAIETVFNLYSQQAKTKELSLSHHIADETPAFILADPTRLRQVLANLISNALKFTSEGAISVRVESKSIRAERVELTFSVSDTGIGIPAEKLDVLFEPFKQVDASTTRRYGGTGLGLSICKLLCEVWDGKMWVESTIDKGTTFYFTLPARITSAMQATTESSVTEPLLAQDQRILVAEDNIVNQKVARRMLEGLGYTVDIAPNGLKTLEALEEYAYPVVLMDVHMPEMDGLEATRELRKRLAPDRQPRIIALTANAMTGDRERYLSDGMDDYLSKPLRLPDLKRALGHVVEPKN